MSLHSHNDRGTPARQGAAELSLFVSKALTTHHEQILVGKASA